MAKLEYLCPTFSVKDILFERTKKVGVHTGILCTGFSFIWGTLYVIDFSTIYLNF